jgi:hypothetical protein
MVTVSCPICREDVRGYDENDLSANLQGHMVKEHKLKDTCDLNDGSGSERACKPSASGEMANLPYEKRMRVEEHAPPADQFLGEDVMQTVRCPVCGDTILGHTAEDLSFNLEEHIASAHRIDYKMRK